MRGGFGLDSGRHRLTSVTYIPGTLRALRRAEESRPGAKTCPISVASRVSPWSKWPIVLVIIGLLLGGILKGQELITSARVRNIADQNSGVQAAYYGFIDRYRQVPGDWSQSSAVKSIPGVTTGGDSSGRLDSSNAWDEGLALWEHLSKSGFIQGNYTGGSSKPDQDDVNLAPRNAFNGFLMLYSSSDYYDSSSTPSEKLNLVLGTGIPVNVVAELDRKIDDGLPQSGVVRQALTSGGKFDSVSQSKAAPASTPRRRRISGTSPRTSRTATPSISTRHGAMADTAAPALAFRGVGKSFGQRVVLADINLEIARGEALGLVGVNGAGKTTLLRALLDLARPDQGSIEVFGTPASQADARQHLSYLAERFSPPGFATGLELLRYLLALHGLTFDLAQAREQALALDLDPAALARPARHYSKGMAQKLGLIACVLARRPLLVLDEPMSGLDPRARARFKRCLAAPAGDGRNAVLQHPPAGRRRSAVRSHRGVGRRAAGLRRHTGRPASRPRHVYTGRSVPVPARRRRVKPQAARAAKNGCGASRRGSCTQDSSW
jgi:ABC-2 type transport system ATP-binding protein